MELDNLEFMRDFATIDRKFSTMINPWLVDSLMDFCFFLCPECDFKGKTMVKLRDHAIDEHDKARKIWSERYVGRESRAHPDEWTKCWEAEESDVESPDKEGVSAGTNWEDSESVPVATPTVATNTVAKPEVPRVLKVIQVSEGKARRVPIPRGSQRKVMQVKMDKDPDKPYICVECDERVADVEALLEHTKAAHGADGQPDPDFTSVLDARDLSCKCCSKRFDTTLRLLRHQSAVALRKRRRKKAQPAVCDTCGDVFHRKVMFRRHMFYKHGLIEGGGGKAEEGTFFCDECKRAFLSDTDLRNHNRVKHSKVRDHVCHLCGAMFKYMNSLNTHKITKHQDSALRTCSECDFVGQDLVELIKHFRDKHPGCDAPKADGRHAIQCRVCDNVYSTSAAANLHMRKAHGLKTS